MMADEVFPFTFPISFEETEAPPTDIGAGTVQFRVVRRAQNVTDGQVYDVRPLREAFDRFASGATVSFIDPDGTKLDDYPYGQRVEIQYSTDGGDTYTERFEGWTVDATRTTRDGIPQLDVDLVGHDHLLRRNTIEKDYSSETRSAILEDIVRNYTPVDWNAGADVTVQNDETIDYPLRGVRPDSAIAQLASESANEEFGVDNDFNFFFRQQSTSRISAIGDEEIIDHDLPKSGKRAVNRVRLYYGSALDNVVVVEDREEQKELKEQLGTSSNAVLSVTDSRPEISSEERAEAVAFEQLGTREVIQTGEITLPLGRLDASAGDVFALTLSDAGISSVDFRIAQIDYRWQRGETVLTIARQEEDNVDDLLVSLSDAVTNVKMRDADPNATETRYLGPIRSGVTTAVTTTVETRTTDAANSFIIGQSELGLGDDLGGQISASGSQTVAAELPTVTLHNAIRDRWQDGGSPLGITSVGVGADGDAPNKADSSLLSQLTTTDVDRVGETATATQFEVVAEFPFGGTLSGETVAEFAPLSPFIARATVDPFTVGATQSITVRFVFDIDVDTERQGVITTTGQERTVDLLLDSVTVEPTDAVYGDGTATPAESDAALGNKLHEDTLDSEVDGPTGVARWRERTTSGEATTTNWSEFGLENGSNELLSRVVFEALNEDVVLELIHEWQASNA